jgi:ABC-type branched-subunit amino acid transport system permease subunit
MFTLKRFADSPSSYAPRAIRDVETATRVSGKNAAMYGVRILSTAPALAGNG